jgi:transposase-like protein
MQLEAIQQCGAEPYEQNEARTAQRNGHKERSLKTRVGELILEKPQFRGRSFKSCIFDNYSRVELALTNAIAESYLQGVRWKNCWVPRETYRTPDALHLCHFSRAVMNNIPNKDKEAVAEKLRQVFEDQAMMAELAVELRQKRYSKSADTIDRFSETHGMPFFGLNTPIDEGLPNTSSDSRKRKHSGSCADFRAWLGHNM